MEGVAEDLMLTHDTKVYTAVSMEWQKGVLQNTGHISKIIHILNSICSKQIYFWKADKYIKNDPVLEEL